MDDDKEPLDALPIQEPEQSDSANERTYSWREKALRDRYVGEYLQDYDCIAAAMRVGYSRSIAKEYGPRFMDEPYVMREISRREVVTEGDDKPAVQKRIMAALHREANYRGPGSSQAARVAALSKLAQLNEMEPASRSKTELTGADGSPLAGTFVLPGIMTIEEWERAAAKQQDDLVSGKIQQVAQIADETPPTLN